MLKVGLAFCLTTVVVVVVLVTTLCLGGVRTESLVDFYENLIATESQKALQYEFPVDASRYRPKDGTILGISINNLHS